MILDFFLFHPFHDLLLGKLCLFAHLLRRLFNVVSALVGLILPYDLQHFLWVIRCERWLYVLLLHFNGDKLFLLSSFRVQIEPVVEVLGTNSPSVADSFRTVHFDAFYFIEHDGFGGGKGEVILFDEDVGGCYNESIVLI